MPVESSDGGRANQLTVARTNTYNYISGSYFIASLVGSTIGSLLLSNHVYLLNALSIFCYLATAYIATSIPAHYGRDDPKVEALESSYDDISSPVPPSMSSFERSTAKVLLLSKLHFIPCSFTKLTVHNSAIPFLNCSSARGAPLTHPS